MGCAARIPDGKRDRQVWPPSLDKAGLAMWCCLGDGGEIPSNSPPCLHQSASISMLERSQELHKRTRGPRSARSVETWEKDMGDIWRGLNAGPRRMDRGQAARRRKRKHGQQGADVWKWRRRTCKWTRLIDLENLIARKQIPRKGSWFGCLGADGRC